MANPSITATSVVVLALLLGPGRDRRSMAFRIEWLEGHMRLSGQLRSEQLDQLRSAIDDCGSRSVLDLTEVDLVDVEAIRFLNSCEARGISVLSASGYIRAWMTQERERQARPEVKGRHEQ